MNTCKTIFLYLVILMLSFENVSATTYTFIGITQHTYSSWWLWSDGVVPPNPLPAGDVININDICEYDDVIPLTIDPGATLNINNNGVLVFNSGGLINNSSTSNTSINGGVLSIGIGVTFVNNNIFTNNGQINNYGTITNNNNNGFINNNVLVLYNGSIQNGTYSFDNNNFIRLDSGTTTFSMNIDLASGSLIDIGNFYSPNTFIINGTTQDFSGTRIHFNIYGNGENDKILLPNAEVILTNSSLITFSCWYQLSLNDSLTIIDAYSFISTPATINYPFIPIGLEWETTYLNGNLTIKAVTSQTNSIHETTLNELFFNIYPNPTSGIINLNNVNNSELVLIFYDSNGHLVKSELFKNNQRQVNIDDLSNGVYIVVIKSEEWTGKKKLIIQR